MGVKNLAWEKNRKKGGKKDDAQLREVEAEGEHREEEKA